MRVVASFDIQVTPDIRLFDLRLMEAPDGNRFTYAAESGPRRTATFARTLAEHITIEASKKLEAVTAHGKSDRCDAAA